MDNVEYNNRRHRLLEYLDDAVERGDYNLEYDVKEMLQDLDDEYYQGNDDEVR